MNRTAKQFEGLLARYFETLLQDNPTFSTICAGLRDGEGKLGRLTLDFHAKRERERQSALRALEGVSPRELTGEQQLDRLALRSLLLKECEDYARGRHALEPNAPDQLLNILLHELQRGDDEPRRAARNLRSLLRQAPDFLDEAAAVVRNPERVWLRVMEQAVTGGVALLEGVGKFLQKAAPQPGDAALVSAAGKAMQRYRQRVKQRPPAPAGSFAIGAAALQRRVRDELGLDYTLGQVEALALGEVERVGRLLKAACARFGRNRSAEQIIAEARASWRPGKPLLELYQRETRRIARGIPPGPRGVVPGRGRAPGQTGAGVSARGDSHGRLSATSGVCEGAARGVLGERPERDKEHRARKSWPSSSSISACRSPAPTRVTRAITCSS